MVIRQLQRENNDLFLSLPKLNMYLQRFNLSRELHRRVDFSRLEIILHTRIKGGNGEEKEYRRMTKQISCAHTQPSSTAKF